MTILKGTPIYTRKKGQAAMFRSKCRWIEKEERQSITYLSIEKRHCNKKVITELEETIPDDQQILSEIETYYGGLYNSKTLVSQERGSQLYHPYHPSANTPSF